MSPDLARFNTLYGMLSASSPVGAAASGEGQGVELKPAAGDIPSVELALFKDAQDKMKEKLVGLEMEKG